MELHDGTALFRQLDTFMSLGAVDGGSRSLSNDEKAALRMLCEAVFSVGVHQGRTTKDPHVILDEALQELQAGNTDLLMSAFYGIETYFRLRGGSAEDQARLLLWIKQDDLQHPTPS